MIKYVIQAKKNPLKKKRSEVLSVDGTDHTDDTCVDSKACGKAFYGFTHHFHCFYGAKYLLITH